MCTPHHEHLELTGLCQSQQAVDGQLITCNEVKQCSFRLGAQPPGAYRMLGVYKLTDALRHRLALHPCAVTWWSRGNRAVVMSGASRASHSLQSSKLGKDEPIALTGVSLELISQPDEHRSRTHAASRLDNDRIPAISVLAG